MTHVAVLCKKLYPTGHKNVCALRFDLNVRTTLNPIK